MGKNENSSFWRKLDNSAKLFPICRSNKYSSVFRFSVVLKENIDPEKLKIAVEKALEKYVYFKVKLKTGLFWNYLEKNEKEVIIEIEDEYPCKYINPKENNDYVFKVTYFSNKINIDIFHSLTDGNNGSIFFKEIVYNYLELVKDKEFKKIRKSKEITFDVEDSYLKNYDKNLEKGRALNKKSYILKGKKIPLGAIAATHFIINLEELKNEAKKYETTITQYLTAILMYCIYKQNYIKSKSKRNLTICIPVNLKKYFKSNTISNFFSFITVEANKEELKEFNYIIGLVKDNFKNKLSEDAVKSIMSSNIKITNNILIRFMPLLVKKAIIRASYVQIGKFITTTFSNIGRISIEESYKEYIDYFMMLIAPEPNQKVKCSSCSFENKIIFTFTSILNDNKIEKEFLSFLKERKINVEIESNGVLDDISE